MPDARDAHETGPTSASGEVHLVRGFLARLFPGEGPVAGEIVLWSDNLAGAPLAILTFWTDSAVVPPGGALEGGNGWHLEFPFSRWRDVVALLRESEAVAIAVEGGTAFLTTGQERPGKAPGTSIPERGPGRA